jgi:hypothetical protein
MRAPSVIRRFLSNRKIDAVARRVAQGARPMSDAITDVEKLLRCSRDEAMSIMHLRVGRIYAARNYEQMLKKMSRRPGLKKRWIYSGRPHHPGHVLCAVLTRADPIPVSQAFEILDSDGSVETLRYPHDPLASESNTVHCGCMMVAVPEP